MLAHILIRDIVCYAHHGALLQERRLGQKFRVSLELDVELPPHGGDRLEDTIDYRCAVGTALQVMNGERRLLLETLAGEIAEKLLELPRVTAVKVQVAKPHPPIPGVEGGVAVEISRSKR